MNKKIIIAVATIVGAGSFYGGMKYAQSRGFSLRGATGLPGLSSEERQARMQQFSGGVAGARGVQGGGFVSGEIIAKDDKSITIKVQNGGSKIVFFSSSAEIAKSISGTITDLEIGKNITVNGTANQDGSVTAQTIQVR